MFSKLPKQSSCDDDHGDDSTPVDAPLVDTLSGYADTRYYITFGITKTSTDVVIYKEDSVDLPFKLCQSLKHSFELDLIYPCEICGIELRNYWADGTSGHWKVKNGGIGCRRCSIELRSQPNRGMHWGVRWFVKGLTAPSCSLRTSNSNAFSSATQPNSNDVESLKAELEFLRANQIPTQAQIAQMSLSELDDMSVKLKTATDLLQKRRAVQSVCIVCLENAKVVLFYPCCHKCTCVECANAINECPLCRTSVKERIVPYD